MREVWGAILQITLRSLLTSVMNSKPSALKDDIVPPETGRATYVCVYVEQLKSNGMTSRVLIERVGTGSSSIGSLRKNVLRGSLSVLVLILLWFWKIADYVR